MTELFHQLDAIAVRKKPIENDNIVFLGSGKVEPLGAIGSDIYCMALVRQVIPDKNGVFIIVFDNKDFHEANLNICLSRKCSSKRACKPPSILVFQRRS